MILLSADTSSTRFSVALFRGDSLVDESTSVLGNRHSSELLPAIDQLLCKNSYKITDIDAFCVGLGPGSFTGLRVGITTMRAMALALKKPIIGVASIDAIASNLIGHTGLICTIIDARQHKVYARFYNPGNKTVLPKGRILLLPISDLCRKVKEHTLFCGDGLGVYKQDIEKHKARFVEFAPESVWYPRASILGGIGIGMLKKKHKDNVYRLAPLYIYPRECQIKKPKKKRTYENFPRH